MNDAANELSHVAKIMTEHRLDSVKMPSGLEVLKTTHSVELGPSPEAVDEAVNRKLEALGILNATEESGRVPVEQDEVMFAASSAPEISLDAFRPQPGQPVDTSTEDASDADSDE